MEDRFYRTLQPRRWLRQIARKASSNKRRTVLVVLGVLLLLYFFFDNKGILARIRLEHQRQEMVRQLQADTLELKNLHAQIDSLQGDRKTLEKVAREKYGMVRKGETVYKVKKD